MRPIDLQHPSLTLESIALALADAPKSSQRKLLALQLLLTGKSHKEVCSIMKIGRNSLTRWIKVANAKGIRGLFAHKKAGRPVMLAPENMSMLEEVLLTSPRTLGFDEKKWTGRLFQKYLEKQFGKSFSPSSAYKIFKKVGALIKKRQPSKKSLFIDAPEFLIKIFRRKIVHNLA